MIQLLYFKLDDFKCRCGCGSLPKDELMIKADKIRLAFGSPLVVTSGKRCEAHNKAVGGAKASRHMLGEAVDLVPSKRSIADFHAFLLQEAEALDIWVEHPTDAPTWGHCQITPYPSWGEGKTRVFRK